MKVAAQETSWGQAGTSRQGWVWTWGGGGGDCVRRQDDRWCWHWRAWWGRCLVGGRAWVWRRGRAWRGRSGAIAGTIGGVASPVGEQAAYLLRGELGTLKVPASPEAKEGNCWDQEANLILCTRRQRWQQ